MIYTIISFIISGAVGFGLAVYIFEYKLKPKQDPSRKEKEPSWKTSWAVLQRLKGAATEPASLNDCQNNKRELGDLWRTVLLSDLQELLHHAGVKKQKPPTLKQRQCYLDMLKQVDSRLKARELLARMLKIAEHPDNPLP